MGSVPVIEIEPISEYNLSTNGECNISDFNLNRAKGMIKYVMNRFIQTNYMYNSFDYRGLAYDPNKLVYVKDQSLSGDVELRRYSPDPPEWLYDEVRLIVYDITQQIRNDVHLDREINNENYPLPGEIMNATAVDLTAKIKYPLQKSG